MEGTDSLRELAPNWSLAGDEKLLVVLQNTHQKIVSKCREVNTKLNEMATTLDSASINLQNVNNKFMALSNSQFIESRVYDDDADVTTESKPIEVPTTPEVVDDITLLRRSLAELDRAHELTEILDSDTDDSDAEISVVLKPKDLYWHRPLPYIIGSQAWKNKWHAGLLLEDSDSDSVTSKPDILAEEFSESEDDVGTHQMKAPDATISETSSSFHSEKEVPEKKQTPADVAAELAARLGSAHPRVLEEPEDLPRSTTKAVYKSSKPISSTIFSDEPPPLEEQDSDYSQDDDIFAEINKKPYIYSSKGQNRLTDDLFGNSEDYEFEKEQRNVRQNSTLFYEEEEPELFADKHNTAKDKRNHEVEDVKKPIGGISLFGSNKGTESIGAAILKRNHRKSFSSDESDENNIKDDTVDDYGDNNNANAIFDNLFAKAKQAEQNLKQVNNKPVKEKPKVKEVKETSKPKEPIQKHQPKDVTDLFADNIFDDIDDIFTSNIKIPTKDANKNAKSIFDDDDDDLFSDIAKTPKDNTKNAKASGSIKKNLFDSDDELFSDVKVNKIETVKVSKLPTNKSTTKETNNNTTNASKTTLDDSPKQESKIKPKTKSIFDSDSDDDLFSNVKDKTRKTDKIQESKDKSETESGVLKEKDISVTEHLPENKKATVTETLKAEKAEVFQSPSLFEEDEIDDLFINDNKAKYDNLVENVFEHKLPENIPIVVSDTEENVDFMDKKSESIEDNSLVHAKAKTVDTKPNVFPKLDEPIASNEPKEQIIVKDKVTKSNEASLSNAEKISFNEEDSNLDKPFEKIDEDTKNSKNESVLHKEEKLLPDIGEEIKSTSSENVNYVEENQNKYKIDEVIGKEDIIPQQKNQTSIANFDDIFTEPPAFEKTKETKKTTNVNALFDDDSDDEALFFKKNDVISDEKPDLFSASVDFGIFNDEPPAFVDFAPNRNKKGDLFTSENKEDAKRTNQSDDEWNNELIPNISEDNLFSSSETSNADSKTKTEISSKDIPDSDEDLFSNVIDDPSPNTASTKKSIDQLDYIKKDKKIGKLNTKNFNINVQALVPGASPKKIPKEINEDSKITDDNTKLIKTESIRTKNIKDIETTDKTEQKTVSFENKPASGVLDNKISKQRPKIQVKRRPSSRKARHEAVRKSVIDLDDETDNSSSFDEPLPKLNQKKTQDPAEKSVDDFENPSHIISKKSNVHTNIKEIARTDDKISNDASLDDEVTSKEINKQNENVLETSKELLQKSVDKTPTIDKFLQNESDKHKNNVESSLDRVNSSNVNINKLLSNNSNDKDAFKTKQINKNLTESHDEVDTKINEQVQSTTKVKYILNDEDIFSKTPKIKDLFKDKPDDDLFKNEGIKTIGNTYKDIDTSSNKPTTNKESSKTVQPKKESKSLFDLSDNDDDLFGKSTKTKKVEVKSKLFDSDSEDDLFSGKKKTKEESKKVKVESKKVKEVNVGGSLFGDDDDDLFGAKTKNSTVATTKITATTSRAVSKDTKSAEVVFDDPLSMLDDD